MSPAAQATINGVRPEAVGKEIEQFELCGVFVGGSINYSVRRCDAITRKVAPFLFCQRSGLTTPSSKKAIQVRE